MLDFRKNDYGASMYNYALIIGIVAIFIVLGSGKIGKELATLFGLVENNIEATSNDVSTPAAPPTVQDDTTPNILDFVDAVGIERSTITESQIREVTSINQAISISISGDATANYRICADSSCTTIEQAYGTSASTITNGKFVQLQLTSSANFLTTISASLNLGGTMLDWNITTEGSAMAWGLNSFGQLGNNTTTDSSNPVVVTSPDVSNWGITTIEDSHSCGLDISGAAYCWGDGTGGRLGNGDTVTSNIPVEVSSNLAFSQIDTSTFSCGLRSTGVAYCWGDDTYGQLGNGSTITLAQDKPSPVSGGHNFSYISLGSSHACAIDIDGVAYCWGQDNNDQLGDGAGATDQDEPVAIDVSNGINFPTPPVWTEISASTVNTCALTDANAAFCWGGGDSGSLGNGDIFARVSPTPVSGGHLFEHIDSDNLHACGITTSGVAYCWGDDTNGRLGNGASGQSSIPIAVDVSSLSLPAGGWKDIAVGTRHTCAIDANGIGYCWGKNDNGQLGNNVALPGADQQSPVAIAGGYVWADIDAGDNSNIGVITIP